MAAELAFIPDIQQISESIICVLGQNPGVFTLNGTNTYLVGTGTERFLIDSGDGKTSYISVLKKAMTDYGCKTIKAILITHWHLDHIGGVPSLWKAFDKDIPVYKFMPEKSTSCSCNKNIEHIVPIDVIKPLHDKQVLSVEGASLEVHYTPGHASDHVCFLSIKDRILFAGDNVLGTGTGTFEELTGYMSSLDAMKKLNPSKLLTGHGPVVENGIKKIEEYIVHRQKRITQITNVLINVAPRDGFESMDITKIVYAGYAEHLLPPANSNTLKVLEHLVSIGVVILENKKYRHKDNSQL